MSGFESAIRNAIARAPDGRPQTRARIYDAARTSLERNLARAELPDADARRQTLELTIERIEAEWRAIAMARPGTPRPPDAPKGMQAKPATAVPEPPMAEDQATRAAIPADVPESPTGNANLSGDGETDVAASTPNDPSPSAAAGKASTTAAIEPRAGSDAAPDASIDVAPTPSLGAARNALDPTLAAQLVERDGNAAQATTPGSPEAAVDQPRVIVPPQTGPRADMAPDLALDVALDPMAPDVIARTTPLPGTHDDGPIGDEGTIRVDADVPEVGPVVDVPDGNGVSAAKESTGRGARRKTVRGEKATKGRRGERAARRAGRDARPKAGSRGRWIARAVSLVLLIAAGMLGWRWLDGSGMLEPGGSDRVAISVPGGNVTITERDAGAGEGGDGSGGVSAWTALMTRELSGAVEPVAGQEASRVTGRAEIALDAEALAALGPNISLSLAVRAVGATGEVAVACDFEGGGCGRFRFPVPREAGERVVTATIGDAGEARLLLDPTVSGEAVPFDLLGVTARAR